jgi:hypothetical protein
MDAAVKNVRVWVDGGWVSRDPWAKWIPELSKAGRNQDVADLALLGILGRPSSDSSVPLMEYRARALLALSKSSLALTAAKSYYNLCDMKLTPQAVGLVGQCLAKAHPEDADIAKRFREEQANASMVTSDPPTGRSPSAF